MRKFLEKYKDLILASFLWFCVWGTYGTDIFRIFSFGFPHNLADFFHGARALLPFLALAVSIIILIRSKKFSLNLLKGPLGLFLLYSVVGVVSSAFSKQFWVSLYWALLYAIPVIVLLALSNKKDLLKNVVKINCVIAGLISIGLVLIFISHSGMSLLQIFKQFLSGARPFENIGNILAGSDIFGMAGSRPTGLGRYAGVSVIVAFAGLWSQRKKIKILSVIFLFTFSTILIFSRARTSVVAILITILVMVWFKSKFKVKFLFVAISVCLLLLATNFYQFSWDYLTQKNLTNKIQIVQSDISEQSMFTLSGRTQGIWPEAWRLFLSSPLIGRGFQADRIFLNGQHTHNSILQSLVQTGILGTLFFMSAFLVSLYYLVNAFRRHPENIILIQSIGIFSFFILRSITESFAFFGADYLFLLPIFAYLQFVPEKYQESKQMYFAKSKIDLITTKEVVEKISDWIKNESQKLHWVVVTGMHGIVYSSKHEDFKYIIGHANLFVPDGISLVWLGKIKGIDIKNRVSGADLMKEFFNVAQKNNFSNYFYGDTQETLKELNSKLLLSYPKLKISGIYSPPFKELTNKENEEIISKINLAKPDVLWVGLGLPKQEKWIFKNRDKLNVPVVIGVGAAFKFLSGKVKRAPRWVGKIGLEWLWRLFREPKTVWKRIFFDMPYFIWLTFIELTGLSRYK